MDLRFSSYGYPNRNSFYFLTLLSIVGSIKVETEIRFQFGLVF